MGNIILVVDDDADICGLVSIALKNKGFKVKAVETGGEGIKAFGEVKPDIVLLDHRLPDMAGDEVARKIKSTEAGKNVSIIMMSGEDTVKSDEFLYCGTLKKPFKLSDMVEYVEKKLKK
jgi:DNA-binding response OmpR family regulator